LRQVLADLRQTLGDERQSTPLLLIRRDTVQLNPDGLVQVDVAKFTSLLDQCAAHRHRHMSRCGACAARLEQALALYRGDLLAGMPGAESLAFTDWLRPLREQLHERTLHGLATLAAYHERNGDYAAALNAVRRQLALEPWREEAHRSAMRLHALLGDRSAALAQYARCRAALAGEFGIEPDAATTAISQALRNGGPITSPFAPTRALRLPQDSPAPLGREEELSALGELLADAGHRLITIVGPGGVGKTCLAIAAARANAYAFADGAVYVPLAGVHDVGLLPNTLLTALELAPRPDQTAEAQLIAYLSDREILLVLDNLEHLLADVGLLTRLVQQTSAVTLLVTSRERLALRAEWIFDLSGLAAPPLNSSSGELAANAAVSLFVQRARQVQRRFALDAEAEAVAGICRMVEGLPLALELAAGATRRQRCAEIAAALSTGITALSSDLHDLPERQRSLQAAFSYSWQLLTPGEQQVLRRLSVFRGGFEEAEAAAVAGATRRQLHGLYDKSLLRRAGDGRFDMHELIRQYAANHMAAAGEAEATQGRHLHAMLALAQQAEPQLTGPEQQQWLERLEREHNNLRAALTWGLAHGQIEAAARLGGALWRFWWRRDYLREGREWLGQLLHGMSENGVEPTSHAGVLKGLAALAHRQGDFEEAQHYYQQELTMRRALGSTPELVAAMSNLAATWSQQGRYGEAEGLLEACVVLDREQSDSYGLAHDLGSLGLSKLRQGFYAEAHGLLSESLALHRQHEDTFSVALTLANLGSAAHGLGDIAALGRYTEEALGLMRTLNNSYNSAIALENLAYVYRAYGDMACCTATLQESLAIFLEMGSRDNLLSVVGTIAVTVLANEAEPCVQLLSAALNQHQQSNTPIHTLARAEYEAALATARDTLSEPAFQAAWTAGQAMGFEEMLAFARGWLGRAERDERARRPGSHGHGPDCSGAENRAL
jgi:predicted ATPase/DNA-binding SARP family transcriptional activator